MRVDFVNEESVLTSWEKEVLQDCMTHLLDRIDDLENDVDDLENYVEELEEAIQ